MSDTPVSRRTYALELAREFAQRFAAKCDPARFRVTLFGSRARGDAEEDSDVDLFVELVDQDSDGTARRAAWDIAGDLTLERGILVSVFVADRDFMEAHRGYSLLEAVAEEGIPVDPVRRSVRSSTGNAGVCAALATRWMPATTTAAD